MFNLLDYQKEIKSIASSNNCTNAQAVELFIVNLTVMKEQYSGASQLNFHTLGQQWNSLGYKQKKDQKKELLQSLSRPKKNTEGLM